MKLLVFTPYYPPHFGGLENYAEQLNKYLSKKVTSITVFVPNIPATSSEIEEVSKNITIIRYPALDAIPNYPIPKFWLRKYWQLKKQIYRVNYDVIISHTRFFHSSLLACQYAKKKGTKWIHIEHGSDYVQTNNPIISLVAKQYDHTYGKKVLRSSDINVAISKAVGKFIHLFDSRVSPIIYRGIEIEEIDKIKPNTTLKDKYKNKDILLYAGRLIDGKGVKDLISALTFVHNENWVCLIVGDGPEKPRLIKQVESLNLKNKVHFLGQLTAQETISAMKIADVFINPSYTEGLPTTILEAAVCKNAILATNVGGTGEVIKDNENGLIVSPRSPSTLAEKIDLLLNNKSLATQLGANARSQIIQKFNWPHNTQVFLDLLKKVTE